MRRPWPASRRSRRPRPKIRRSTSVEWFRVRARRAADVRSIQSLSSPERTPNHSFSLRRRRERGCLFEGQPCSAGEHLPELLCSEQLLRLRECRVVEPAAAGIAGLRALGAETLREPREQRGTLGFPGRDIGDHEQFQRVPRNPIEAGFDRLAEDPESELATLCGSAPARKDVREQEGAALGVAGIVRGTRSRDALLAELDRARVFRPAES